jgi:peptidoglycan/LPS O-acetylase OafA/YrhL
VVRLLTFAAVIGVHAVAFTEPPSSRPWAGVLMLLQFGREVFFALTGFVLVHSAGDRTVDTRSFWRRRFPSVLAPYLAWSAIYLGVHALMAPGNQGRSTSAVLWSLATGNAEYHLYFLLVSMQLYLVFPLLLRFVRRTADRAGPVLGAVAAVNVAWLAWLQYGTAPAGWAGHLWPRAYELLPTYAIYVLAGAYAALHLERIERVCAERRRLLLGLAAGAAVLSELAFVAQLGGREPRVAAAVLQPAMVLTSLAALIVLYLTGRHWAARGRPGAAFVARASDLSFGVYLAHPLVLEVLLRLGLGNDGQRVPSFVATALAMTGTAAGATALAVVARRSRWSLALTGRPRAVATEPRPHELRRRVTEPSQVGSRP